MGTQYRLAKGYLSFGTIPPSTTAAHRERAAVLRLTWWGLNLGGGGTIGYAWVVLVCRGWVCFAVMGVHRLALRCFKNLINRVRNGYQPASSEAWIEPLKRAPEALPFATASGPEPLWLELELGNSYLRSQAQDKLRIIALPEENNRYLKPQFNLRK